MYPGSVPKDDEGNVLFNACILWRKCGRLNYQHEKFNLNSQENLDVSRIAGR